MLTSKDRAAINAAKPGKVITLSDGRRIVVERSSRTSDCHACELHDEDCDGLNCDNMKTVYRNERGIC